MKRKRFDSEKSATEFAAKVDGKVNDLREIPEAKSAFTVTYESNEKTKSHGKRIPRNSDWLPEEGRDFGYPNDFWN